MERSLKEVKIEITNACPRNCIHCSSDATDIHEKYRYLDKKLVENLIDQSYDLGARSIVFTGGEATLHPNLKDFVYYAKNKYSMRTKLYTMCYRTVNNLCVLKSLSLFGLDEIIYSTASELVSNEELSTYSLIEFIEELQKISKLKIGFHQAVTNKLTDNIVDMVKDTYNILDDNHRGNFSFLRYVPHGRGDESLLLNREQEVAFKSLVLKLKEIYGDYIRLGSPYNVLGIDHVECTAGEKVMIIGFDGNVYPCDAMKYFDAMGLGGNIHEKTLTEIFDSEYFKNVRSLKIYNGAKCKKCGNFDICKGGCLGQKMIYCANKLSGLTFNDWEVHAKRTKNDFGSEERTKLNAETGLFSELGRFAHYVRDYYGHNPDNISIELLHGFIYKKIGDIAWYIVASLSAAYKFSAEELAGHIFKLNNKNMMLVDEKVIKHCAMSQDPMCPYLKPQYYPIARLDNSIDKNKPYNLEEEWKKFLPVANNIIFATNRDEVIESAAKLIYMLAELSNRFLHVTLEDAIKYNIEYLKRDNKTGFNAEAYNDRIKEEANRKLIKYKDI